MSAWGFDVTIGIEQYRDEALMGALTHKWTAKGARQAETLGYPMADAVFHRAVYFAKFEDDPDGQTFMLPSTIERADVALMQFRWETK